MSVGHTRPDGPVTIGTADVPTRRDGGRVRARLVNTDPLTQTWAVGSAPFTVVAIDGVDVLGPTPLRGATGAAATPPGTRSTGGMLADLEPGSHFPLRRSVPRVSSRTTSRA